MILKTLLSAGVALAVLSTSAAYAKPTHKAAAAAMAPATPTGPIPYDQMKANDAKADAEAAEHKAMGKKHHKAHHHHMKAAAAPAADKKP